MADDGAPQVREDRVVRFRPERNATLDTLRWARKRHQIPVLLEVDITSAREGIRHFRRRTGRGLSLTAWVVSCVARAVAEHPRVHGIRRGKREILLFGDVDVAVVIEREVGDVDEGETLPMPVVIRKAQEKDPARIHEEIRRAQEAPLAPGATSLEEHAPAWLTSLFFRLPGWMRDAAFWRWLLRSPERIKRTMGTVAVTSVGMATPGLLSWGVPLSLHPLAVAVGGVARREEGGRRMDHLALTLVFDHAVVDGAPVGRFIHRLQELLTRAESLADPAPPPPSEPLDGTSPTR